MTEDLKFRSGDEVIDIISGKKGKVLIEDNLVLYYIILVKFEDGSKINYMTDGRININDKRPRLFHYIKDYDYSKIDWNDLPKKIR